MTHQRLKVLLSAYACEPGKGSEPGVGWNVAINLAIHHDVWVLTRANNRSVIEQTMSEQPVAGLNFFYHDLPKWFSWWKEKRRGTNILLIWQLSLLCFVRRIIQTQPIDIVHHLTFGRYWPLSPLVI